MCILEVRLMKNTVICPHMHFAVLFENFVNTKVIYYKT